MRNRLLAVCLSLSLVACEATEAPGPAVEAGPGAPRGEALDDIQAALSALPAAELVGASEDGLPYMIRGDLGTVGGDVGGLTAREAGARAERALEALAPVFRLRPSDLVAGRLTRDERDLLHLRYSQVREGLPVFGHELILHLEPSGRVFAANGSARGGESAPAPSEARLSAEDAGRSALEATPGAARVEGEARLLYARADADSRLRLAFEVVVTGTRDGLPVRDHVFIDALEGSVVTRSSDIQEARNRRVYSANNGYSLPGVLVRSEGQAAVADPVVNKAYDNLGLFYDCYKALFNRDSFNGAGAPLMATVHYGTSYDNAFWDGTQMVCGDGPMYGSLCSDPDVVVHEFGHAVTDSTSNLTYTNESGGLNESLSDVAAAFCESWTLGWGTSADVWSIGEYTFGTAALSLADPARGDVLDFYGDYATGVGVHASSGISSLAFALLSQGGTHPRGITCNSVPALGVATAAQIFHRANTNYFVPTTTFAQAKTFTEQVADLYYGPAAKSAVTQAWLAVGVGGLSAVCPPTSLSNGVGVRNLYGATGGTTRVFSLAVPAGSSNLVVQTSGGTGDADLYLRLGAAPTSTVYDCRPYLSGSAESCVYSAPSAGTYYIVLRGRTSFAGVTLRASFTRPDGSTVLWVPDVAGATGSMQVWTYSAVAGQSVTFALSPAPSGTTGDADLYVRFGATPTPTVYDCRSSNKDNLEQCGPLTHATAGTYSILVHGYSAFTGVDLLVR